MVGKMIQPNQKAYASRFEWEKSSHEYDQRSVHSIKSGDHQAWSPDTVSGVYQVASAFQVPSRSRDFIPSSFEPETKPRYRDINDFFPIPYPSGARREPSETISRPVPRVSVPYVVQGPPGFARWEDPLPWESSPNFPKRVSVNVSSIPVQQIRPKQQVPSRPKVSTDPNHLLKITRKAVADETLSVLRKGVYTLPNGKEVNVGSTLKTAVERATCFSPEYYFLEHFEAKFTRMVVEVTGETSLQACKRLYKETGGDVGCLAFASGKNPGGGFLGGSGGQEESIARSSAYYLCVIKDPQLYEFNRSHKDPFHSDHLIVCPNCPVVREESEPYTLHEPWPLTVISAPAVNAGVVRSRNLGSASAEAEIHRRMKNRIRRILGAAVEHGVSRLVLGEYGCGALENNPRDVARYFREELLSPLSPFACAFDRVVFAVHDDVGPQNCGRQRTPCLPDFAAEICPPGQPLVITREPL